MMSNNFSLEEKNAEDYTKENLESEQPTNQATPNIDNQNVSINQQTESNTSVEIYESKKIIGNFKKKWIFTFSYDAWHSIFSIVLIIFATAIFCSSVVPYEEWYTELIACLLAVMTLLCLFVSISIDPGIVPPTTSSMLNSNRNMTLTSQSVLNNNNNNNNNRNEFNNNEDTTSSGDQILVVVNNCAVECKFCRTCHIIRPPRCSHCRFCDVCVEEFDHHCGVIGSCVGKRTFRFFTGFFVFLTMLCAFAFARCLAEVITVNYTEHMNNAQGRWHLIATFGCLVASVMTGMVSLSMSCIYLYLSWLNRTQKEMRNISGICEPNVPFHKGYFCNLCCRLFGPLPSSKI